MTIGLDETARPAKRRATSWGETRAGQTIGDFAMLKPIRAKLTYANVVSTLCLFLVNLHVGHRHSTVSKTLKTTVRTCK